MLALRDHLNAGDQYTAIYTNMESGQAFRNDIAGAMMAVLSHLHERVKDLY